MFKIKNKKIILEFLVLIICIGILSTTGYAIYSFGFKDKNINNNLNNETLDNELKQIIFSNEEEKDIIENNCFNLKKFKELILFNLPDNFQNIKFKVNDFLNPNKIKISFDFQKKEYIWYYSIN